MDYSIQSTQTLVCQDGDAHPSDTSIRGFGGKCEPQFIYDAFVTQMKSLSHDIQRKARLLGLLNQYASRSLYSSHLPSRTFAPLASIPADAVREERGILGPSYILSK